MTVNLRPDPLPPRYAAPLYCTSPTAGRIALRFRKGSRIFRRGRSRGLYFSVLAPDWVSSYGPSITAKRSAAKIGGWYGGQTGISAWSIDDQDGISPIKLPKCLPHRRVNRILLFCRRKRLYTAILHSPYIEAKFSSIFHNENEPRWRLKNCNY